MNLYTLWVYVGGAMSQSNHRRIRALFQRKGLHCIYPRCMDYIYIQQWATDELDAKIRVHDSLPDTYKVGYGALIGVMH